jgi:iron complex transport system permease protein
MKALALSCAALALFASLSLMIGPVRWGQLSHELLVLRVDRLVAGVVAGAALAVAGVLMQGLFRNPLASPSVCGVSEGAGLATQVAILAITLMPTLPGVPVDLVRAIAGMAGAGAALAVLLMVARRRADTVSVLLVGLVLSLLFSALAAAVLSWASNRWELGRNLVVFTLGGIDAAQSGSVALVIPLLIAGLGAAWAWSPALDVLLTGEEEAAALGLDVRQLRLWVLVWASALVAVAVSLGGGVAFVGLVVPNLLRLRMGPAHRPLVAAAAIGGAAFVTAADVLARLAPLDSGELPLGVVTSLVGAPIFLWLLARERTAGRM